MLAYRKNCKLCNLVKKNSKLLKRIYDSSYYIPHSKDSLNQIYKDCNQEVPGSFSYLALLNHVKKHQHINSEDYAAKMLKIKSKQAENKIISDRFEAIHVQDAVMNEGMRKLEDGTMKITADHLLRAAKDKQDAKFKQRDQQIQLAEMVAFYTSGEDKYESEKIHDRRIITLEEYDPAIPIAENPDSGEN